MGRLIYCETIVSYRWHIRRLEDDEEPKPNGHKSPRPLTFCGLQAAWDIPKPSVQKGVHGVCAKCKEVSRSKEGL